MLISCTVTAQLVTAQLICTFVFAYAKIRFSHDTAEMVKNANHLEIGLFPLRLLPISSTPIWSTPISFTPTSSTVFILQKMS